MKEYLILYPDGAIMGFRVLTSAEACWLRMTGYVLEATGEW